MNKNTKNSKHYQITGAPEGIEPFVLSALAEGRPLDDPWGKAEAEMPQDVIFVARDDVHLARVVESLGFFAPSLGSGIVLSAGVLVPKRH